ncbi:MAG: hypothetical protein M3O62_03865 [Pseudomonadota bacterium]|nr:hypothetical protein [Pseudomonadota bacterium]
MARIEDIRFGHNRVRLARPELLVKIDAEQLVQQFDVQASNPQAPMDRDDLSIWVAEAAAVLHSFAGLNAKLGLRFDTAAVIRLADAYPDLYALSEHSQWPSDARNMLARCAAAIARDEQEFWAATDAWSRQNKKGLRPLTFSWS